MKYPRKENETVCQHALRVLKKIRKDNWLIGHFTDGKSKCCAVGHYKRLTSENPDDFSFRNCADFGQPFELRRKTMEALRRSGFSQGQDIATINNSPATGCYTEPSVKARVIHFLEDAVKNGY